MNDTTRRWGLRHAAAVLAFKLGVDLIVGLAMLATWGSDASAWMLCLASAVSWIPVLALLVWAGRRTSDEPLVRWRAEYPWSRAAVGGVGLAVIAISMGLAWLAGDASTPLEEAIRTDTDRIAIVVFALVIAPVVEEVFFRGYLYRAAENALGGGLAVLLVGLVFGVFHGLQYAGVPAALAAVTVMGLGTTWIRYYTGALLPCVALHVVYNAVGLSVLLLDPAVGS